MANAKATGPKVPLERPDKAVAARDPKERAEDRPDFDLGGAVEPENKASSDLPPGSASAGLGGTATGRGPAA